MKGMIYVTVKELMKALEGFPADAEIDVFAHTDMEGGVACHIIDADDVTVSADNKRVEVTCYEGYTG